MSVRNCSNENGNANFKIEFEDGTHKVIGYRVRGYCRSTDELLNILFGINEYDEAIKSFDDFCTNVLHEPKYF